MPKIDISAIPVRTTCVYPDPYAAICEGREKQALGDAGGLDQFGVNLTRLRPGAASANRHWHKHEDEFVFVLEGTVILVEDSGEVPLKAGDAASFKAGVECGHMLINKSQEDCIILEVGTRADEEICSYTDVNVDMRAVKETGGGWQVRHKDGSRY